MNSNDPRTIIDRIFSQDVLREIDKTARVELVKRYETTGAMRDISAPIRLHKGQSPHTGNVISSIPPQGIIIGSPGTYTFAHDVTWNPPSVPCAGITIASDDVVLDMGGFSLRATVPDNSQVVAGIAIANPFDLAIQRVTIRNGTLVGMGFYGIYANNVSALKIENVAVSGLNFSNLKKRLLCPAGIHIDGASDVAITNCTIEDMHVTADSSAGVQILRTSNGTISGCQVRNLINDDGSVQGYSYIGSSAITTSHSSAANFQSHFAGNIQTPGHTVLGFIPIFCADLKYEHCSADTMIGCCDDCHGMSVFLDASVTVTNFIARNVTDGVTPSNSGAKATGLEVYGASVQIEDCSVENIKAINPQDKQSTGFSAWGAAIKFSNCKATGVIVCDENGKQNADLGYGTGFGWASDPRTWFRYVGAYNIEYVGCGASDCQVGFDTWYHVNSTWTDISCTNCGIDILVEPGASRTLSCNPCSECNPPITAVIRNIASGNRYPGGHSR
jgi:Right handed beta helix region